MSAELLVWPALVLYGEAAVASAAEVRRPGAPGRLAVWGVRLGWLAQTALLASQAAGADGFPWSSRAGALLLLSWLVVGIYLVWGCRPRYRLLGLAVAPLAAGLLALAWAGGGTAAEGGSTGFLLGLHVAVVLVGLAGFTVAAALAALYLWHERRLKRRERTILRLPVPPLDTLERLARRTAAAALAALTAGVGLGAVVLVADGGHFDAAMAATLALWAVYAGLLVAPLHGRRHARGLVAAFTLVVLVLPLTHFAA